MGVGINLIAVIISPTRLPLYTEPCPPVFSAPMFSKPDVIVKILLIQILIDFISILLYERHVEEPCLPTGRETSHKINVVNNQEIYFVHN
jgi:hypothetical protein